MSRRIEAEVLRQIALYAGVERDELHGGALLRHDLGLGTLTILMLLVTLGEVLGRDVLTLRFDLEHLNTVDDLVELFCLATSWEQPRISYCLH